MRDAGIIAGIALLLAVGCAGGQSGAEGAEWKHPGAGAACAEPREDERSFDPHETLRMLEKLHRTSLAWLPTDPFANVSDEDVALEVQARGAIERDHECGFPQVEVTATLELAQSDRKVEFSGRAFLRGKRAELNLVSRRDGAKTLLDPNAAVRGTEGRRYRLQATVTSAAVSGELRAESMQCSVARLPANASGCDAHARRLDWDESIGGFALEDALAEVQAIGPQTLITADRGRVTSVELEVSKADGAVCATPDPQLGADAWRITAPVRVRARADEGAVDATLPATLTATADADGWLELRASASPAGIPMRARVSGRAIARTAQLGAAFAEIAPLALIDVAITTQSDGASGEVTVIAAERKEGWPELETAGDEPVAIAQPSCAGIDEGGRMFAGYWSYFDEGR